MKITYLAATSLDGFIARADGDVSWLDNLNIDASQSGLEEFFGSVDSLVMGRKTYDFVFNYGSWPYETKPTWVFSHHPVPPLDGANLITVQSIDEMIQDFQRMRIDHVWLVGGGRLASSFLKRGLITHLSISEMPVTLGQGIPLFAEHLLDEIPCEQKKVHQKSGFRHIEIEIRQHL